MHGRAVVVKQAREDRLDGAGSAADLVGGLQDRDVDSRPGQDRGGGEPVRAAAHDGCGAHGVLDPFLAPGQAGIPAAASPSGRGSAAAPGSCWARVQVTVSGIGPFGSQGCSRTASATFQ